MCVPWPCSQKLRGSDPGIGACRSLPAHSDVCSWLRSTGLINPSQCSHLHRFCSVKRRLWVLARLEKWGLSFSEVRTSFTTASQLPPQGNNIATSCLRGTKEFHTTSWYDIEPFVPWRECLLASLLSMHVEAQKGTDSWYKSKQLRCEEKFRCGRRGSRHRSVAVAVGLWENPLTSLNLDGPEIPHLKNRVNYICPICFIGHSAQWTQGSGWDFAQTHFSTKISGWRCPTKKNSTIGTKRHYCINLMHLCVCVQVCVRVRTHTRYIAFLVKDNKT